MYNVHVHVHVLLCMYATCISLPISPPTSGYYKFLDELIYHQEFKKDADLIQRLRHHWGSDKSIQRHEGDGSRKDLEWLLGCVSAVTLVRDAMLSQAGEEKQDLSECGIIVKHNSTEHVSPGTMPHVDAMLHQTQVSLHMLPQALTISSSLSPAPEESFLRDAGVSACDYENMKNVHDAINQMVIARGLSQNPKELRGAMCMSEWSSSLGKMRQAAAQLSQTMERECFVQPGYCQLMPGPTVHRAPPTPAWTFRALGFGILTPKDMTLKVSKQLLLPASLLSSHS